MSLEDTSQDTTNTDAANQDTGVSPDSGSQPSWWIDKDTPGNGERPEWLPEKFKSAEDAAKSYIELEKRLGTAPKEYDLSKGESWLDPEFDSIKEFADYAKNKNVPQDVMDKMLESVGKYINEFTPDFEAEKEKLGKDADDRLSVLNNWIKTNFTEDTYKALFNSLNTADSVKAIEEIRQKMINDDASVPSGNADSDNAPDLEGLQAELTNNLDKYKNDPKYRAELRRRMEIAAQKGPYTDKSY